MTEDGAIRFPSGDHQLTGHLVRPARAVPTAGVVIAHGFPADVGGGANSAATFPELAARIANELGWVALTFHASGCEGSEGDFSLAGWLDDLRAAVDRLTADEGSGPVWMIGFGTGGALAICSASTDERVRGVAAIAAPADFDDWARNPRRLLLHARGIGAIRTPDYPADFDEWSQPLRTIRARIAAAEVAPRPLLVLHGNDDDLVPVLDARVIADAHGAGDLRIIEGAGHHLRHDPRAIAVLLGWLDRQRNKALA